MVAALQTPQSYRSRYLWLDRERGRFLVHRSAYTSPEIFEEEKRRILRQLLDRARPRVAKCRTRATSSSAP